MKNKIKKHLFYFHLLLFSLFHFVVIAQVTITFPMEKAVFQRNNSNVGTINFAGTYTDLSTTSIEAKLTNAITNATVINWTTVTAISSKGVFKGSFTNIVGGWYTLDVRIKHASTVLATTTLSRVGIGEVFVAAGQSNAQGLQNYGSVSANEERVVTHNYLDYSTLNVPDFPQFSKLESNNTPSKMGQSSWAYGKLGDLLVGSLGVPVMFLNGASGGSTVLNWKESSDNLPTNNIYSNTQFGFGVGMPYGHFKNILQYYCSMFGVRAVLWHQGESDSDAMNHEYAGVRPSAAEYQSNLQYVINKSRQDINNSGLNWVVSRASFLAGNTYQPVIDGQNATISNTANVYAGPSTDNMQIPRIDGVHFQDSGLIDLANAWYNSINSSNVLSATPIIPQSLPSITVTCNSSEVLLSAPYGYASYKWIRTDVGGNNNYNQTAESTAQQISRSTGTYRCYLTNFSGLISVSHSVDATNCLNFCNNVGTCTGTTYVSDIPWVSSSNGFGPVELDKSVNGEAAGDGNPLILNGVTYTKGLGVHSPSTIIYNLSDYSAGRFQAKIGVDDEIPNNGCSSIVFEVYKDNSLIYQSPIMYPTTATISLDLDITGATELKLVTSLGDGFNYCDHADWADAKIVCNADILQPSSPTNLTASNIQSKCLNLQWGASTDNIGVSKYLIYVDNVLEDSVASNVLSYGVTGLSANNTYSFSVKAKDAAGNKSLATTINNITTGSLSMQYTGPICTNLQYFPTVSPTGGVFKLVNTSGATINTNTGELIVSAAGTYTVRYITGAGACKDSISVNITAVAGQLPPIITANKTSVTTNEAVTLIATGCTESVAWSNIMIGDTITLTQTGNYTYVAYCTDNTCMSQASNQVTVSFVNCKMDIDLIAPTDNKSNVTQIIQAGSHITAVNKLANAAIVDYKAGNSIILQPGFTAESGTVFSTTLEGCQ